MTAWATLGVGVTMVLFSCSSGEAAAPSFQGVGDLPGGSFYSLALDVSGDGLVVVGTSVVSGSYPYDPQFGAFRWENGVMTALGDLPGGIFESMAWGASADGSVIVGQAHSTNGYEAFRWENGVMSGLGPREAYATSADGSVVVGMGGQAFRWENGVMSGLGDFPGGLFLSFAYGVSADGSVVVGYGSTPDDYLAALWQDGVMTALGSLPEGHASSSTSVGISADGSVVVGWSTSDASAWYEAFRWENGVMAPLQAWPGGFHTMSAAADASGDGSVVVGKCQITYDAPREAFIWTAATGVLELRDVLTALGLDLGEWGLHLAWGVSDDGLTIVGEGWSPNNADEGWIATLPSDWIEQVTHELSVSIAKSDWAGWGTVDLEPNLARYFVGKAVTLTALPNEGIAFSRWRIWDPNHPNDPRYITTDANNPLTLVMTADRQVVAVFRCAPGGGMLPMLSVMLATPGLFLLLRRKA